MMIYVVDILSEKIDLELIEFLHDAITEVGKNSYDYYSCNSSDDLFIVHDSLLLPMMNCICNQKYVCYDGLDNKQRPDPSDSVRLAITWCCFLT